MSSLTYLREAQFSETTEMSENRIVSDSVRKLIVNGYLDGQKYKYLSEVFQLKVNTIKSIEHRYKKFEKKPKGHQKKVLT